MRKLDADPATAPEELFDFAITLAQNTFAMRDWLIGSFPGRQADVSNLFRKPRLQLIRDLTNGSKHLALDPKKASVDADHMTLRVYARAEPRGWVLAVLHRGYSPDRPVEGVGGRDPDGTIVSGTALVPLALGAVEDVGAFIATV
ncbi:MAG: hypothetical protein IT378_23910 [Sandaracinaceae bacterium]|nr:hypothetical protein [Sandaracinaceae bacterium]